VKKIFVTIIAIAMSVLFVGCNYKGYDMIDTNYHFDRAIISMPDGTTFEVEVSKWADADGEQLTITAKDGTRYLVSSYNCILIEDN